MFRKKQTPAENERLIRRRESLNVFSYYANRTPAADAVPQTGTNVKKSVSFRNVLGKIPIIVSVVALVLCLFYISTLSAMPKVQVVGQPTDKTLVRDIGSYETDIQDVFNNSIVNRSKLLIDTNSVAQEVKQEYPELGDISIMLPLVSRRPIVQVRPAAPSLILSTTSGAYIIDTEGRAVVKSSEVESSIRD